MFFVHEVSRLAKSPLLLLALSAISSVVNADAPGPRTGGILVGDLQLDQVLITRDLNGDGKAEGSDEVSVYFDESNLSGLPAPTGSVFSIHQGRSGYQYISDGNTDAVYRLDDSNHDGDANDAGEATLWFSEADNALGFTLPTPNSVFEAKDGAVYIVNAGVRSRPTDAVYRTVDLNGDGDANDEGEASVWLDLGTLASELTGADLNRSSAFDIVFIGKTAYIADTMGGEPDVIFRAKDDNKNGVIDTGELSVFIDDNNIYGAPVATGLTVRGKDLYVSESSGRAHQTVFRLRDMNKNGVIDDVSEAVEVWNESFLPADLGVELGSSFGLTVSFEGHLYLASAGADASDNVFRLVDLDGDGLFFSEAETILWRSGQGAGEAVEFARSLASLHDFLAAQGYFAASNVNDHNDLPKDVGDIVTLLSVIEAGKVPNYEAIRSIYAEGKNSIKPNGSVRSIRGFADGADSKDPNKNFDMIFPEAVDYYGRADFLTVWLDSAIDGTEGFKEASDAQRAAAIIEGLRTTLSYWVKFELRFSEFKAASGNFACPKGAPHNWDEGFAFYYGPKGKHSLYAFANTLSSEYGLGNGINKRVVKSFRKGLKRLVPDRPLPGQIECEAVSRPAHYPYAKQSIIESQLVNMFLLGMLHNAEVIAYGASAEERKLAQVRARAYYLAIAPEVWEVSPRIDRIINRLLKRSPNRLTGLRMKKIIKKAFYKKSW